MAKRRNKRKQPVTNPVDENEESQQSAVEIFTLLSCGKTVTTKTIKLDKMEDYIDEDENHNKIGFANYREIKRNGITGNTGNEKKLPVKLLLQNTGSNRLNVDQFKRETSYLFPYNMCKFASIVYNDYQDEGKEKYIKNLPKGWKLLTTAENPSMGNGYFGATFWNPEREQVVIAHRGTSPTNFGALWTDIKSIYGNIVSPQMSSAVTFTHNVQRIFAEVDKECKTHFKMFFTGHSLGAWLAQICTFSVKYLTIMDGDNMCFVKSEKEGHHAHTVVFDSPGCKPMLEQLQSDFDVRYDNVEKLPIDSLDITSYLSAPNRINTCNPHVGKIFRVFIDFDKKSFSHTKKINLWFVDFTIPSVEYDLQTHSLDNILETFDKKTGLFKKINGKFKIQEVVDWPKTSTLNSGEYNKFFKWATKLYNFHPKYKDVIYKNLCEIRYQTKEFNEKQCSLNVFSQSDQQFLKQYQSVQKYSFFFNFNELFNKKHLKKLKKLSIDESNHLVSVNKGSIVKLYNTVSYIRQLLIKYPDKSKQLETWLSKNSFVENLYKKVSTSYLHSNKKWLKFKGCENIKIKLLEFLKYSNKIVWKVDASNGDTFCTLKQIYNTFLAKFENQLLSNYTKKYCIVLDLKHILSTNCHINMLNFVNSNKNYNQLWIIDYNPNQADNNDDFIKMFFTNLFKIIKSSKTCKIILCVKHDHNLKNILSTNLDKLYIETNDEGFTWNDLDVESQTVLLKRKIVFQEKEKNLNDLIDDFNIKNEIDQLIDHDTLVKLINNDNKIEIAGKNFGIENLEGAYADLYIKVNNKTLKLNLVKNYIKAIYFINGLFENNNENDALKELANILNFEKNIIADKTNYLKSPYFFQFNDNKYIYLVDSQFKEEDFNKLCNKHFNDKKMFWIKWDIEKFILQRFYNPDFYIKRKFHSVLLNIDKKMLKTDECFVFSGINCIETLSILFEDSLIKNYKNIYIQQTNEDAKIVFNEINGTAHLIEIKTNKENKQMLWRDSKGSIQNIRQYIENVNSLENENNLINFIKNKQAIIFADDPGMGKSTTLVKLYQSILSNKNTKLVESNWIIHINLRDHIQTIESYFKDNFNDINIDIIAKFLSKIDLKLSNIFSQNLIKHALSKGCIHTPILISFDGFDELPNSKENNSRDNLIRLLKYLLKNTNAKIWITTRMHYCQVLEDTLSTFAIKFDPMDLQSIKLFILKYLKERFRLILDTKVYKTAFGNCKKNENKSTNKFIEKFLIQTKSLFDDDLRFIGTPLHLHMLLGENGFIKEFIKWSNNTDNLFNFDYIGKNIVNVFENFIEYKYKIYFKKMGIFLEPSILSFKNSLNKSCEKIAWDSFSSSKLNSISLNDENLLSAIFKFENENFKFIHQRLNEYFVSEKCINLIKINETFSDVKQISEFILDIFIKNNYKVLRLFINAKLTRILSDETEWQNSIYEHCGSIIKTDNGFTILDLAIDENNINIVEFMINSLETIEWQLVKNFIGNKGKLKSILDLAIKSDNVEIVKKLFALFDKNKETLLNFVEEKDIKENFVLHLAVRNDNIDIVTYLLNSFHNNINFLIELVKEKDINGYSVLHLAVKNNNVEITKKLLALSHNNKDFLNYLLKDKDNNGYSVLHLAVINDNVEIVASLLNSFNNNTNFLIELIKEKDINGSSILQ
ncbi:hypothetical protein BLOT_011158 [Blomia tropicalis]|nr:hypothetical protein BLOT_011158 [Blomia tropicalis]